MFNMGHSLRFGNLREVKIGFVPLAHDDFSMFMVEWSAVVLGQDFWYPKTT